MVKSSRILSPNSEGILRRTENFYFILITFSFKSDLVYLFKYFNRVTHMTFLLVISGIKPFIYAPLHGMITTLKMFVLNHFLLFPIMYAKSLLYT